MISRNDSAKYAKSKFYESFNDIDVYVEDTASESKKVYVEILSRVLGKNILISQVFPIGSKPTVVKRCKADQGARSKPAIYIVDGDYDCIDNHSEEVPRLYRLKRYCIENYLIDPTAVIDVINDDSIDDDLVAIAGKLQIDQWLGRLAPSLSAIVVAQMASNKKQCDMPTVRIELSRIQGEFRDHIDSVKSLLLVDEYRQALDARWGAGTFDQLTASLRDVLALTDDQIFLRHMSGKALLMPLLRSRLKRRLGVEVDYPRFRVRLARRCNVSEFADLPAKVA